MNVNAGKIRHLCAIFGGLQEPKSSCFSLQTVRGFSGRERRGGNAGIANTQSQSEVDWKEWVSSKLPGTGSSPGGASHMSGPRASGGESLSSVESADDFERRMFGGLDDNDSQSDSFFTKLYKIEKNLKKETPGLAKEDWNDDLGWVDGQIGLVDTLNDGMDEKLKRAALQHDYGALRPYEEYSFRPDTTFVPGTQYTLQDLDLTKPAVQRSYKRPTFQTTTKEVLRKADFRNARFLQQFITESGIIFPRKKFGIRAKAQRKLAREIKTARAFGLLPFTTMGKKPFIFGKTMEVLDEDYQFDEYVDKSDDLDDHPEVLEKEGLDV